MAGKLGRPPLDPGDRSVTVSLRLPARAFDRVCQRAAAARVTVPELIRRALEAAADKRIEK